MSDWIEKEAERIKQQDRKAEEQRQWQIHKQQVIQDRGAELWSSVVAAMHADVAAFNSKFPDEPAKQIAIDGDGAPGITFRRDAEIVRVLQVSASGNQVHLRIIETSYQTAEQNMGHDMLPFDVRNDGALGLLVRGNFATPVEASRHILKRLF